jgi:hypothetical protein
MCRGTRDYEGNLWLAGSPNCQTKPTLYLIFLGIKINTLAMELRLPLEKLRELQALLEAWLSDQQGTS